MHNRATTFISAPFIRTPDTRLVEVYAALDVFKLSLVRDIEPMIEAYAAHKRRSPTDTIDEHTAKVRGEFHQQLAFINSLVSQVFAGDLKAAVALGFFCCVWGHSDAVYRRYRPSPRSHEGMVGVARADQGSAATRGVLAVYLLCT